MNHKYFDTGLTKIEIMLYAYILFTYIAYLMTMPLSPLLWLFTPLMALKFLKSNNVKMLPYVVLTVIMLLGAVFVSRGATLFFIFTALVPPVIIHFTYQKAETTHKAGIFAPVGVSWIPVVLSPLPALAVTTAALYFFPETVEALKKLVSLNIDATLEPFLKSDVERLELPQNLERLYQEKDKYINLLVSIIPGITYASVAAVSFLTIKSQYKTLENDIIMIPQAIASVLVLSQLLIISGKSDLKIIGINGILIIGSILFCRGFDILKYNLAKQRMFPFLKTIIYFFVFIYWHITVLVSVLGLLSLFFNFAKPKELNKNTEEQ